MAVHNLELEEEFSSDGVLEDIDACAQLNLMWSHFGKRLDKFRREHSKNIIHVENGNREWKIKINVEVTCHG